LKVKRYPLFQRSAYPEGGRPVSVSRGEEGENSANRDPGCKGRITIKDCKALPAQMEGASAQ